MKTSNPSRWRAKAAVVFAVATMGVGTALVALTGAASSASTAAQHSTHKTPVVTLQFWNAYNDVTETPVMNGVVIPSFEAANPGIKVKDDTLPYAGLLQKFIASSAAGDPPDLMRSDIAWVPQLASEGTLLETSKQPWFKAVAAAADPGPLSTNYWNGGYYGLPDDTNTQVFFYNKADFAAANLSPPTTWNEMIQDAKTLTIPSKGQHGLGVDSTDIWNVGPFVWTDGGSFTNKKLTKATGFMNSKATESAVSTLVSLDQQGVIGSDMVGGSGAISGETGFPKGQYAMYLDGPWATTTYKDAEFTGYGTSLIPAGPGGTVSVVGGEDLVIAKGGKHLADTIKLVQFLQSPFAQLAMASAGDMAAYKTDNNAEGNLNPALRIFAKQLLTAEARPVTAGYGELDTDFSNQLALMLAGKVSVAQGLQTAAQEANKALAAAS
jgi:multiple sugar transport system substrate-binding protein